MQVSSSAVEASDSPIGPGYYTNLPTAFDNTLKKPSSRIYGKSPIHLPPFSLFQTSHVPLAPPQISVPLAPPVPLAPNPFLLHLYIPNPPSCTSLKLSFSITFSCPALASGGELPGTLLPTVQVPPGLESNVCLAGLPVLQLDCSVSNILRQTPHFRGGWDAFGVFKASLLNHAMAWLTRLTA